MEVVVKAIAGSHLFGRYTLRGVNELYNDR